MLNKRIEYDNSVPIKTCVSHIYEQPVHSHYEDLEIIVILKGSVKALVGYRTLLLKEGEVLIFNDREIHGIYETEEENIILTVHINVKYFKKYNEGAYRSFWLMAATYLNGLRYDKPIEELREHLFNMTKAQFTQTVSDERMESLGRELLTKLLDDFQYFYYNASGGGYFINRYEEKKHQGQAARMRTLMYYLWDNYDQKITLQEYASETFINMYYLSHIIKEFTGLSFQELLSFTRVEESEAFLLETDKKISEIAFECGFSATRYYVKHFKKWFKVSPEDYRKRHMKRLAISAREDTLTGDEAIDVINEFSGQKRYLSTEKSYYDREVVEIDISKKSKPRRKKYQQLIQWNYDLLSEMKVHDELNELIGSFNLCAYVASVKDFNNNLLSFLQKNNSNSILFKHDTAGKSRADCERLIGAMEKFCRASELSSLLVNIEYAKGVSGRTRKEVEEKFLNIGSKTGCKITVKDVSQSYVKVSEGNYILDSVYIVPWIIRSNLIGGSGKKFMPKLFDDSDMQGGFIRGDRGMITGDHIKKPLYYAYMCLSMLGDEIIDNSEGYIVTRKNHDIRMLFYDYDMKIFDAIDDYRDRKKLAMIRFATKKDKEYKLVMSNLKGRYTVTRLSLGKEICIFNKIADMDMFDVPLLEEGKSMREFMSPKLEFSVIDSRKGPTTLDLEVPRYGALMLQLHKIID